MTGSVRVFYPFTLNMQPAAWEGPPFHSKKTSIQLELYLCLQGLWERNGGTCCLKQRVLTRLTERQHLDSLYTRQNQAVDRNYQSHDLTENEQFIMSSFPPSCPDQNILINPPLATVQIPPVSTPLNESRDANPPFNKNFICYNNLPDCFCARKYPARLYECKINK